MISENKCIIKFPDSRLITERELREKPQPGKLSNKFSLVRENHVTKRSQGDVYKHEFLDLLHFRSELKHLFPL